jgi:mevalonate kinase
MASAPGKVILFGEHAVVYGRPAIAVPVHILRATVEAAPAPPGGGLRIIAEDVGQTVELDAAPPDHPLALIARLTLEALGAPPPDLTLTLRSTIPIASGLGSGAAVSAALARALAAALHANLDDDRLSALVFEVEKLHHGTPSGIDNTVVIYGRPVYFVRGATAQTFSIGRPFTLAIADTGIASPTRVAVGDVRRLYQANPAAIAPIFDQIGAIAEEARAAIEQGDISTLGALMNHNHALLRRLAVSCPELDALVQTARESGTPGAKLSGAGRGGNMIALAEGADPGKLERALRAAGAARVIFTTVR